jgi:DNA topoisomerase VI subunit B
MKHLFIPNAKGTHVRTTDGARGTLKELPATATIQPESSLVDPAGFTLYVALQPEPESEPEPEPPAPTIADLIKMAEAHIGASFSSFLLMDGLKRIGEHKEVGTLASIPKTIAVATWVETVKQTALAGSVQFPPAPHTFEEVVSE